MKTRDFIFLGVGFAAAYLLLSGKGKALVSGDTIKLGDKGKAVQKLQESINFLTKGNTVGETGAYDKKTREVASQLFDGTSALKNSENGEIDQQCVTDLNTIIQNINNG